MAESDYTRVDTARSLAKQSCNKVLCVLVTPLGGA
jgi:hypothetical protein